VAGGGGGSGGGPYAGAGGLKCEADAPKPCGPKPTELPDILPALLPSYNTHTHTHHITQRACAAMHI